VEVEVVLVVDRAVRVDDAFVGPSLQRAARRCGTGIALPDRTVVGGGDIAKR
jgi:hypothetical protein